jgi:hypothetical protein
VDLLELVKITNDFETVINSINQDTDISKRTAMDIPVEIWIDIFYLLPSDASRWKLALVNSWFLSIFQSWVGFDMIPLRYKLRSLSDRTQPVLETVSTTNFYYTGPTFEYMRRTYSEDDTLILIGRPSGNVFSATHYSMNAFYGHILAFDGPHCIANIPIGPVTLNRTFPEQLGPNDNNEPWYSTNASRAVMEDLLPVRLIVHPDRNCEFEISIHVDNWINLAASSMLTHIFRLYEVVLGLSIEAIQNLTWNRSYRGILQPQPVSQIEGLSLHLYEYQLEGLAW